MDIDGCKGGVDVAAGAGPAADPGGPGLRIAIIDDGWVDSAVEGRAIAGLLSVPKPTEVGGWRWLSHQTRSLGSGRLVVSQDLLQMLRNGRSMDAVEFAIY